MLIVFEGSNGKDYGIKAEAIYNVYHDAEAEGNIIKISYCAPANPSSTQKSWLRVSADKYTVQSICDEVNNALLHIEATQEAAPTKRKITIPPNETDPHR